MKGKVLFFVVAAAVLLITACDPFGTSETRAYITGRVYADAGMTVPYEGATLVVEVDPDSISMPTVTTLTDANGYFLLEIPFIPSASGEGVSGFGFDGKGKVGLWATAAGGFYVYAEFDNNPLIVIAGDTLRVWDVSVSDFIGGSGK